MIQKVSQLTICIVNTVITIIIIIIIIIIFVIVPFSWLPSSVRRVKCNLPRKERNILSADGALPCNPKWITSGSDI